MKNLRGELKREGDKLVKTSSPRTVTVTWALIQITLPKTHILRYYYYSNVEFTAPPCKDGYSYAR